ncbi:cuticle protein 13-like [Tachypleus tridentatus]|uniref:cuticle protein 13-like n=1 Tax=Tachypleus tridentatus TaxID=6853 RepID=UPI003FD58EB9
MMQLVILVCVCTVSLAGIFPYNVPAGQHDPAYLQALQQQALHYINLQQVPDLQLHRARELQVIAKNPTAYYHGYYHPGYYYPGHHYGGYYHPGYYYSALHHHAALRKHNMDEQKVLKERQKVLEAEKDLIASH